MTRHGHASVAREYDESIQPRGVIARSLADGVRGECVAPWRSASWAPTTHHLAVRRRRDRTQVQRLQSGAAVLASDTARSTFLVARIVQATGGVRPMERFAGLGVFNQWIPDCEAVAGWWAAFEPLALVLTPARYDTPELVDDGDWTIAEE